MSVDLVFLGIVLYSGHLYWGVQVGVGKQRSTSARPFTVQAKKNVEAFSKLYFIKLHMFISTQRNIFSCLTNFASVGIV